MTTAKIRFIELCTGVSQPESWKLRAIKDPFFAWAGLRPPIAQHTAAERQALEKFTQGRKSLAEIGVAEWPCWHRNHQPEGLVEVAQGEPVMDGKSLLGAAQRLVSNNFTHARHLPR